MRGDTGSAEDSGQAGIESLREAASEFLDTLQWGRKP